jgi:hypothetical protein
MSTVLVGRCSDPIAARFVAWQRRTKLILNHADTSGWKEPSHEKP